MTHLFIRFCCVCLLLCSCSRKEHPREALTVAMSEDPQSLDPRVVRILPTVSVLKLLFEGLMRTNSSGFNEPAAASSVVISEDKRTYTFTLRDSHWSDGSPVTAQDFEETWKSILSPSFPAPNAYQLYLIKGAKEAKEGILPPDAIGVKAIDSKTLVVELLEPTPYFLEITTCHFYFPVCPSMRAGSPDDSVKLVVGNGPFMMDHWKLRSELAVVKNPHYWDAANVAVNKISLAILDETTALKLFEAGSLDWAGSPISTLPQDAIASLKQRGVLQVFPGAGTHWFRLNTQKPPFDNEKIRRAFSLALDRQAIVNHITQGNQVPAIGVVPPSFGFSHQNYYKDHDLDAARQLFAEGLSESGRSKADISPLVLSYAANDRNSKIAQAVQPQWSKAFDIDVKLEANEGPSLMDKMHKGTYQISLGAWYADLRDAFNFLEIFKLKDNPTNQTFWHNALYTQLLEQSSTELDPAKRQQILEHAEAVLMQGMPVAPLFHNSYNYLKSDRVSGVYFSPLGFLDFKEARMTD
ncbi:MAG: peptide ABC transporter substrate-binding protein [Parachlamydiaceae bacterium]